MNAPLPIRQPCPPGACTCKREVLEADPHADSRILTLTQQEEKRLVARLENLSSLADLQHMEARMREQLGITLTITLSSRVRTLRGILIRLEERPGLCRKTRQAIPAAIRRAMDLNPEIAYAIVDSQDLLGGI